MGLLFTRHGRMADYLPVSDGIPHDGKGWTEFEWWCESPRHVPISAVVATQTYLDLDRVEKYRGPRRPPAKLVQVGRHYYLADGHHGVVAAIRNGERVIKAKVKRGG